jgi:hypothetical protein
LTPNKKIINLLPNFAKHCKAAKKMPGVPKQEAKTIAFCENKGLKEPISVNIKGQKMIFS